MTGRAVTFLGTIGIGAILIASSGQQSLKPFIWNTSESVPVGLYRLRPIRELAVTNLVAIQPPEPLASFLNERGYLPRGIPMLKRVLALPGQTVCRNHLTITVDDMVLGEARERDGQGRLLPAWHGCRLVSDGEVFFMNWQSAASLDGRYFGVLPATVIVGRADPLWTREED